MMHQKNNSLQECAPSYRTMGRNSMECVQKQAKNKGEQNLPLKTIDGAMTDAE